MKIIPVSPVFAYGKIFFGGFSLGLKKRTGLNFYAATGGGPQA
jgi:hypothetical protein